MAVWLRHSTTASPLILSLIIFVFLLIMNFYFESELTQTLLNCILQNKQVSKDQITTSNVSDSLKFLAKKKSPPKMLL